MRPLPLILIVLVVFCAAGLHAQTASITQGCFPLSVDFTPPGGVGGFFWDFDDGATSTLQNPSHTFIENGTFNVDFSESAGGAIVGTVTIEVYLPPTPSFSSDVMMGCAPLEVNFEEDVVLQAGIVISGYSWVFGDGGNATGANTSYTFSNPGSYSISLGITTNLPSCDVTELIPDYITLTQPPQVSFTTNPSPATSCTAPATFSFSNTSSSTNPLTYSWDFDNGQTSAATNPPQQTFATEGNYTVVLTATDDSDCEQSSSLIVGIGQPSASFIAPDTICIGVPTGMINLSPAGSYSWNFGPDATPSSSSFNEPIVTFNEPGFQDITLTINGDCPDDTTITVFVEEVTAEFISDPTYSCSSPMEITFTPLQSGLDYLWAFHDLDTAYIESPTHIYEVLDTTTYSVNGPHDTVNYFITTLFVTSSAGCMAEYSSTDTIHEPNALAFPSVVQGCDPVVVSFADSSKSKEDIVLWEYFFGDGTSISFTDLEDQMHTYSGVGDYGFYSVITNSAGCTDTSFVQWIEVGEPINVTFSASPTEVCPGETVQFTDQTPAGEAVNIDAWHYTTENSQMFHCFQEGNPSWQFTNETGPQDVTLTVDHNGCYSSVTQNGLVNVLGPIAHGSFECDCASPFIIDFINNSQAFTEVVWDFGDGNTSTVSNPTHTYAETGDYEVILQAINASSGCEDSFDTLTVHIRDIQANFNAPSEACQGAGVNFDAGLAQDVHAECYKGYTYTFSDPNIRPITTAEPIVTQSFGLTGNVTITLTVTDINGCTSVSSNNSNIYGIDAAYEVSSALPTDAICFPTEVSFGDLTAADTTIVSWIWSFGDGNTGVGAAVNHTYLAEDSITGNPNIIQVSFTATDILGCQSTQMGTIDFYTPESAVSVSDAAICSGDSIAFSATDFTSMGSNLDFAWDFANGGESSEQNPTEYFLSGGDYNINLIFTEQSSGCIDSTQVTVEVADYPLAGFTSEVDSVPVICPNENVIFNDTSVFNGGSDPIYQWDFGNDLTSIFSDPGTFYADNGTYTVNLYVEIPAPFGCADSTSQDYVVYGPMGDFSTDIGNDAICRLDEVIFTIDTDTEVDTFYWDFGDGVLAPGTSPVSHVYDFVPPSGQTFAAMIMSNEDGSCPLVQEVPINIHEVVADFDRNFNDVDTAICFQPYPLTNVSLNSDVYYWDFGDDSTSTVVEPGFYIYDEPGTYGITLAVFNELWGCTDTLYKEVVLHPLPELAATGDSICEGELGNLDVIDPHPLWNYTWTTDSEFGVDNPAATNTVSQPLMTSLYNVLVTDTNTCTAEEVVGIIVINPADVTDLETIVPIGDIVTLPVEINYDLYFYDWSPDDFESDCLTCDPAWVQAFEEQEYNVVITDVAGCFTTEGEFIIDVHPETFVSLPTTFTPNGDGINDIIYVEGWGVKELIEYKIFNRWGEMIFESTDMERGWDGRYKGVLQNNDVYVYKVSATTWLDEVKTLEGHINLMR